MSLFWETPLGPLLFSTHCLGAPVCSVCDAHRWILDTRAIRGYCHASRPCFRLVFVPAASTGQGSVKPCSASWLYPRAQTLSNGPSFTHADQATGATRARRGKKLGMTPPRN